MGFGSLPLAAGTGRSTSVTLSHGAGSGGKGGGADGTEGGRLGEGCAKHRGLGMRVLMGGKEEDDDEMRVLGNWRMRLFGEEEKVVVVVLSR